MTVTDMSAVLTMFVLLHLCGQGTSGEEPTSAARTYDIDPNGYLIFCLCMGRIGNQMEHFLGSLAFAKGINRTLVLPPFATTYTNVPFTEYYSQAAVEQYHRAIPADVFMEQIAPKVWPVGKRIGFCKSNTNPEEEGPGCRMKYGSPFGPFWDGLGVDFDDYVFHGLSHSIPDVWTSRYPASDYPVIARKGAPASFPVKADHRPLQKYVQFSARVTDEGDKYIAENFPGERFIGIHLRNGGDWRRSCAKANGSKSYMASPQCLDGRSEFVTSDLCLPSTELVLDMLEELVNSTGIQVVFVATDKYSLKEELTNHLTPYKVRVFHMDPWLPQVDQHILIQADHFIGNCVSSFTSFVTRSRDVLGKKTLFLGLGDDS